MSGLQFDWRQTENIPRKPLFSKRFNNSGVKQSNTKIFHIETFKKLLIVNYLFSLTFRQVELTFSEHFVN